MRIQNEKTAVSYMIKLFQQIEEMRPTWDGWAPIEKCLSMAALVVAIRPKLVLEVGVFGGASFLPMAMAQKHNGIGQAVAVDPWSSAASIEGYDPVNAHFWGTINHDAVYKKFMDKVVETGTQNIVKVHRVKSDNFYPPDNLDIASLDGQHTDQAIRDVNRYASKIRVGGYCILDDLNWTGGFVLQSEARLRELGFVHLYPLGTGAVYQRIR
jgi:cephalosporin hydroxylase